MSSLQMPAGPAPICDPVWRMFQETNTRFQETDRRFKLTERLMKERAADTDRIVKDLSRSVGALGNRLGEFVEAMVNPGLVRLFQEQGLTVHRTMQNLTHRDDDGQFVAQVDILVVNSDRNLRQRFGEVAESAGKQQHLGHALGVRPGTATLSLVLSLYVAIQSLIMRPRKKTASHRYGSPNALSSRLQNHVLPPAGRV